MRDDDRTFEELRAHYEVEKELANRLRNSSRAERLTLYTSVYNELFQRVPLHPQLTQKALPGVAAKMVAKQMNYLQAFLTKGITFLEVGAGDCALSVEVCKHVKQVVAIDVSDEIVKGLEFPPNFKLILSDGCSIPVEVESIDLAYSHQLMEHLHPDDAFDQLKNIYTALARGGKYICKTPNRLNGPHDVSRSFDVFATGFHLKEYSFTELVKLFKEAGFASVKIYTGARGILLTIPVWLMELLEFHLDGLPYRVRILIARSIPFRLLLGGMVVGKK
jgi:SAM-dependent methyltransferase